MANEDLNNIKKALGDFTESMRMKQISKDKESIVADVTREVSAIFAPMMDQMSKNTKMSKEELLAVAEEIANKISIPEINIPELIMPSFPEVKIPTINVPKPEVTVNVPKVVVPDIVMPDEMDVKGFVGLMGYDKGLLDNPLPVQLRDKDGRPVNLLEGLTAVIGGGGGVAARIVKVSDINLSAYTNSDDRLRVSVETGGSGLTDNELRAASVPFEQVSGSTWSVSVNDSFRTTVASNLINADDRLRVSLETGGSGLTDAELRASSVPSEQVSGSIWSTNTTQFAGDALAKGEELDAGFLRVHLAADQAYSTVVNSGTVTVTGITDSTTAIIGDKAADEADGDSNPVKIGGVARTANPTAVANGDRVSASYDDVGRQLIRPIQVRDAIATAYITEADVGEISLLAGVSGEFHDLLWIVGANESDAAINLDFRGSTGGTVMMSLEIPANGTSGIAPAMPYRQAETDSAWTVQNSASDNSNTNYSVTAQFSKEV